MTRLISLFSALLTISGAAAQQYWHIGSDGKKLEFVMTDGNFPHSDHIEMSGESVSFVLRWELDRDGCFNEDRSLVFPMLRTIPNNTHASLMCRVNTDIPSLLNVNNVSLRQVAARRIEINGALKVVSDYLADPVRNRDRPGGVPVRITRTIFPSVKLPVMCERYEMENTGPKPVALSIPEFSQVFTSPQEKGVGGSYLIRADIQGSGHYVLQPGERVVFDAVFQAYAKSGGESLRPDVGSEYAARMSFVANEIDARLILETPDEIINTQFRYAKIRAAESIYKTKGGYMHGPGGERFYAAIWANDQAEYVNPFFPFLGYGIGNESAINSFRHWYRFMNDSYKYLPSSIIAEGDDIWDGAGDRGDAAMIAYGAGRYALASGDKVQAKELWPLIEWCLEYCDRNMNEYGVVASDSDELENRFPSGDANLCTSTLYYDALLSACYLGREIGVASTVLNKYRRQASELRKNIESFFGARVSGYDTYRYYEGNDVLRSWICMPLIVGIYDRADETVRALFGPELYTPDGCLTAEGSTTFWDRSTLYSLRGAYQAGYPDLATEQLSHYSARRLLGAHVPYPIEAWPEGNQRHLSAESGLYCRIITEGLFGIRPTGLRSFDLTPQLPGQWDKAALRHIHAFGGDFDIIIRGVGSNRLEVDILQHGGKGKTYHVSNGNTINIKL